MPGSGQRWSEVLSPRDSASKFQERLGSYINFWIPSTTRNMLSVLDRGTSVGCAVTRVYERDQDKIHVKGDLFMWRLPFDRIV